MDSGATRLTITEPAPWRGAPRDAATLIVVDGSGPSNVRLLLGRRGDAHVFMPGKFVFPGGRVDPADVRLSRALRLDLPIVDRLLPATPMRFDRVWAGAVALAGIREAFEEAGLMIGAPVRGDDPGSAGGLWAGGAAWSAFAGAGLRPDVGALVPVARAITPPGQVRRYDTRFFCVGSEAIGHRIAFERRPDPELDSLGWYTPDEASSLDLPGITRQVLSDVADRLRDGAWRETDRPMPFYRLRHRRLVRDMI